ISGTTAPTSNVPRSANFAVDIRVYTGIATSATSDVAKNPIDTHRNVVPSTRPIIGRAISCRNTYRPTAPITVRKTIQRAITRPGVAAVSEIDGITNCGAGPGFGPTANVNAPRTGCPSGEMARQETI